MRRLCVYGTCSPKKILIPAQLSFVCMFDIFSVIVHCIVVIFVSNMIILEKKILIIMFDVVFFFSL